MFLEDLISLLRYKNDIGYVSMMNVVGNTKGADVRRNRS